jgi:hypothetical protein
MSFMSDVVKFSDMVCACIFTEVDNGNWTLTEWVLHDPQKRRRLVRTQIEELWALYEHYQLPEFENVRQVLTQMRQAYRDVEPFNHPLLAAQNEDPFGPRTKTPHRPSARNTDSTGTSSPLAVAAQRRFW